MVSENYPGFREEQLKVRSGASVSPLTRQSADSSSERQSCNDRETSHCPSSQENIDENGIILQRASLTDDAQDNQSQHENIVWLRCDVYDTGIGIPGGSQFFNSCGKSLWMKFMFQCFLVNFFLFLSK